MTDQQQSGEGLAIHLVAAQQAQLLEHGGGQQMRLVDDDQRGAAFVGEQVGEGLAQAGDHARLGVGRGAAEL